jgi:flagellar assembly protein FliH
MPAAVFLETFDLASPIGRPGTPGAARSPAPEITPEMLERTRLEGYETGYKSGWDDATRATAEDRDRIGAEFARNLQDLSFTFHEARAHVIHALEPLLGGILDQLLPRLVSETLGQTIVEELLPLAAAAADTPIEVVVGPASRPALEVLLDGAVSVPLTLVEEETLAEGQVYLRSGGLERELDFPAALTRIRAAIAALYDLNEKAFQNG